MTPTWTPTWTRRQALLSTLAAAALPAAHAFLRPAAAAEVGEDGMHKQPWFHQSFLDLKEDLAEAEAAGKGLAVFFEQRGCPYCGELHKTSLADPEVAGYISDNFLALQINLYGAREVTDFDGKKMEERKLAERWRVNFTPTIVFFPSKVADAVGKSGRDAEVWRLQGYWKPFHTHATFVYVKTEGYRHEPNFQRWLSEYAEKLRAEGKDVKLW